jgi:hypothetical protein
MRPVLGLKVPVRFLAHVSVHATLVAGPFQQQQKLSHRSV